MRKIAIALLVLLAAGAFGYQKFFRPKDVAPAPGGPPGGGKGMPVEAEAAQPQHLSQEIIAVGSLRSAESVTLSSEIPGRIAKVQFTEGQPVTAGAVLFVLDDSVQRAELGQASASLSLSKRNHERAQELFGRQLVSTRERDEAAARLDLDKAGLALAQARFAKTRITAPFSGVVGLRSVSPGDYITPGQALAPLEQLQVLKADFRLSEVALSKIAVGQVLNLEVDAYPGQIFPGKVYAIDPRLAEATRSIGVRARVPNDKGRLRPGLFARVKLVIAERPQAILVPEQAIIPQGDKSIVYVIEDGKAAIRPVQIGLRQDGRAEVTSGLVAGDLVITAGMQKIGPGAPVMPINLAPPPGAETQPAAIEKKG
ncbi:MAG TPA: efflux RND transporter periplasmic adaptor subunit [Verrucomicrobiae bacterium]|nr:efflux RND transporter periplasmic adaptor subunit [Verrucomicrobiae bacterium]